MRFKINCHGYALIWERSCPLSLLRSSVGMEGNDNYNIMELTDPMRESEGCRAGSTKQSILSDAERCRECRHPRGENSAVLS